MVFLIGAALAADVTLSPGDDVATLTAALQPGDEVVFTAGTYTLGGPVTWTGLGTADQPIVLRGQGDVTLELTKGWVVAYVTGSTFLTVQNLAFRSAETNTESGSGLVIDDSSDVTVKDVEVGPINGTALYLSGNNARITVQDTHLHDSWGNGVYAGCGDASCWTEDSTLTRLWVHDTAEDRSGIELDPGCQGVAITDSVVYRVGGYGIVTDSAEYGDRNSIEGNAVWEAIYAGIYVRGSALVRNNVVFNTSGNGLLLTDGDRGTAQDTVVSFNTISDTGEEGVEIHDWAGYTGMVLANNVIANPTGRALAFNETGYDDSTYISGNVVTGLVDGLLDTYAGADSPYVDGAGWHDFVDAEAWDFYLVPGASPIDAADPSAGTFVPEEDFNGGPRDGAAPDAGAYEFDGEGNPGWPIQEGFKDVDAWSARTDDVQGGCCSDKDTGGEAWLIGVAALGWRRRRR